MTQSLVGRLFTAVACAMIYLPAPLAQTLQPANPAKEYIRLGGQVIAIENSTSSSSGGSGQGIGTTAGSNYSGSSCTYNRSLTIAHSLVANSDQSNFPVLLTGTYPFLATTAYGGKVQNANGYDVIFTSDAAGQ